MVAGWTHQQRAEHMGSRAAAATTDQSKAKPRAQPQAHSPGHGREKDLSPLGLSVTELEEVAYRQMAKGSNLPRVK